METKFKASFNWDLDLQSFIFGDMNDKGILVHAYWRRTFSVSFLFLFSTYGSTSIICKWTVVIKNLK